MYKKERKTSYREDRGRFRESRINHCTSTTGPYEKAPWCRRIRGTTTPRVRLLETSQYRLLYTDNPTTQRIPPVVSLNHGEGHNTTGGIRPTLLGTDHCTRTIRPWTSAYKGVAPMKPITGARQIRSNQFLVNAVPQYRHSTTDFANTKDPRDFRHGGEQSRKQHESGIRGIPKRHRRSPTNPIPTIYTTDTIRNHEKSP